jgi:hypothetical protein
MAQFFSRFGIKIAVTLAVLYCTFFMQIGSRTLWQHMRRIAGTPEAQELGSDIVAELGSAKDAVKRKVGSTLGSAGNP